MDVDVQAAVGFQQQRGLKTGRGKTALCGVLRAGLFLQLAHLGEPRHGVFVLVGVVVAGKPKGGVVAGQGELGVLLAHNHIVELLLAGQLVAQADTFVVDTETERDVPLRALLHHLGGQLVVVVAYGALLAPYGLPRLVESASLGLHQREAVHQTGPVHQLQS